MDAPADTQSDGFKMPPPPPVAIGSPSTNKVAPPPGFIPKRAKTVAPPPGFVPPLSDSSEPPPAKRTKVFFG